MSVAPLHAPADDLGILDPLLTASANSEGVEPFLADLAAQLEALWSKLDEWQRAIASERLRLDGESREQRAELARQQAELEAERERVRQEILRELSAAAASMIDSAILPRQATRQGEGWSDELTRIRGRVKSFVERPIDPESPAREDHGTD